MVKIRKNVLQFAADIKISFIFLCLVKPALLSRRGPLFLFHLTLRKIFPKKERKTKQKGPKAFGIQKDMIYQN